MNESNPYVEARREWNDRYLDLVRERRWWQAVAGTELVLSLILAGGLVWLSLQHKTVPYVVEVDSLGAALAIKPAEDGGHRSEEHTSELQSPDHLVCRLLLEKKNTKSYLNREWSADCEKRSHDI